MYADAGCPAAAAGGEGDRTDVSVARGGTADARSLARTVPAVLPIGAGANGLAPCRRIYDLLLCTATSAAAAAAAICRMQDAIVSSLTRGYGCKWNLRTFYISFISLFIHQKGRSRQSES